MDSRGELLDLVVDALVVVALVVAAAARLALSESLAQRPGRQVRFGEAERVHVGRQRLGRVGAGYVVDGEHRLDQVLVRRQRLRRLPDAVERRRLLVRVTRRAAAHV